MYPNTVFGYMEFHVSGRVVALGVRRERVGGAENILHVSGCVVALGVRRGRVGAREGGAQNGQNSARYFKAPRSARSWINHIPGNAAGDAFSKG